MKKSNVLKWVTGLALVGTFIIVGAVNGGAAPKKFNWTLTTVTHTKEYQGQIFLNWAQRVSERTNGNLDIKVRMVSELGYNGTEQLREVKSGAVQWAVSPEGYVQGDEPAIGVTWLPFITPSRERGRSGFEAVKPLIDKVLQKKWNSRLMWMNPFPEIAIHTTKREIHTLNDFKGLKLRSPGGYWAQAVQASGGAAVLIPLDDTYTALAQGTVDGAVTSFETFVNLSWYEVCHVSNKISFAEAAGTVSYVNLNAWNSLPDDYKKILLEECQKVEDELWARAKTVDADLHFPMLKQRNQKFVTTAPKLAEEWMKLCRPIWKHWAERGGETTEAIIKAYTKGVGISY